MTPPAAGFKPRVSAKFILGLFAIGLVLTLVGTALLTLGGSNGSLADPSGLAGMALIVGGIVLLGASVVLFTVAVDEQVEGPKDRVIPSEASDPGPVHWFPNPFRESLVRKETRTRWFQYGSIAAFVADTLALGLLFAGLISPPFNVGLAIIGLWFVFMTVFAAALSFGVRRTSVYVPTRLGFSEHGLHADYDATLLGRRKLPIWVPRYAPWAEIANVTPPDQVANSHLLQMDQRGGGQWLLDGLDTSLIDRVTAEWGSLRPKQPAASP